jgi:hypothetical protein
MKKRIVFLAVMSALMLCASSAVAQNLLTNGTLDVTYQQEIAPGVFAPKPASWTNNGSRAISGPFEDELSSEPWAGQAPTPVTTGGVDSDDWGLFFKPFQGNATDGAVTAHFYQDVPATPGLRYNLSGWAGAEANFLAQGAEIALEFLDGGGSSIPASGQVVNLLPTLTVDNGLSFDYKQYFASGIAPAGAISVRSRASMIGAMGNPAGGGQAFVVDDFVLTAVPEPATLGLMGLGLAGLTMIRRRK